MGWQCDWIDRLGRKKSECACSCGVCECRLGFPSMENSEKTVAGWMMEGQVAG
jgi:hypothetical protein